MAVNTILVAVDGSPPASRALEWANDLAAQLDGTLVALHVIIGQLFGLHFWTHEAILTILWINIPGLPKLARALFRRRVQPAQDSVQAGATALP